MTITDGQGNVLNSGSSSEVNDRNVATSFALGNQIAGEQRIEYNWGACESPENPVLINGVSIEMFENSSDSESDVSEVIEFFILDSSGIYTKCPDTG